MSMIQYVNTTQEFIRTKVKEGEIILSIRCKNEVKVIEVMETLIGEFMEEFI